MRGAVPTQKSSACLAVAMTRDLRSLTSAANTSPPSCTKASQSSMTLLRGKDMGGMGWEGWEDCRLKSGRYDHSKNKESKRIHHDQRNMIEKNMKES